MVLDNSILVFQVLQLITQQIQLQLIAQVHIQQDTLLLLH